jgi:hypothetical protein
MDRYDNCHKSIVVESTGGNVDVKEMLMSHSLDGAIVNQERCEAAALDKRNSSIYDTPASSMSQRGTAIKFGVLEKCKLAENGVKTKTKKDWCSAYAYLYVGHLLFYKDKKSAEKTGKHYPAPTGSSNGWTIQNIFPIRCV